MATSLAQLEARVVALVDTVLAGGRVEDDLVECKREWPPVEKARQLAASANAAQGEPILWIIGLDEDAHCIVAIANIDLAEWSSQIESRFDQGVAPLLRHSVRVVVGNSDHSVMALLFETDRTPYVVKNKGGGSPEREVPIRDGTRTRSAHRHELLRMLAPAIGVPNVILLDATISATWHAFVPGEAGRRRESPETISIDGHASVFLEHTRAGVLVLPLHEMSVNLVFGPVTSIPVRPSLFVGPNAPPPPTWGISTRQDALTCTASGRAVISLHDQASPTARAALEQAVDCILQMNFGVIGTSRSVRLEARLHRDEFKDPQVMRSMRLGQWSISNHRNI
jgi:hypothetical protein